MMRKTAMTLALFTTVAVSAQELPQPSPKGEVEQIVGLTTIEVEYSRPSAKGRKIFGDLVPFGEMWRTGANKSTTVEVEGDVMVEGQLLPKGKYSLFTTPNPEMWVITFNKNPELGGVDERKAEEDVLTVKVPAGKCDMTETFTIGFADVKDDKAVLELRWENTLVGINLHADATKQALMNIKEAVNKPDADYRVFNSSARFLVDRNMEPQSALKYAMKSVEKERKFWNLHTLALAQAQNGQFKEAIATAEESMRMAQEAKYEAYVKMNKERIDEWMQKK
jgi:hypothetical protein